MFWNDERKELLCKLKKAILTVILVIVFVAILSVLQYAVYYYSNPVEKGSNVFTTGCLLFKYDKSRYKIIQTELRIKKLHYFFHNHEDAVEGDIYVNGYSLFGKGNNRDDDHFGFYCRYLEDSNYATLEIHGDNILCNIITVSKDLSMIVCAVKLDSSIIDDESNSQSDEYALLVIPASNQNNADSLVKEAISNSQHMKDWLSDHDWITSWNN